MLQQTIIKDRVVVKGYGYITNYTHIEGNLVINGEDPDFRLSFPCTLKGKCEIKSNDDVIFITDGEISYVYNKGCGITKGKRTMYKIIESTVRNGHLLHRIEATSTMCFGNFIIKPGGWIESNLGTMLW